jgi:hypothetical protein
MRLTEFKRRPRGPALFDTWLWERSVETELGPLPVELYCDIDALPNEAMVNLVADLAAFAKSHGTLVLDLIYAHYQYAERNDWLRFWKVSPDLAKSQVLAEVEAIILNVHSDLFASVHVDPRWDPEHKLCLTFADGAITEINDAAFLLKDGVLTLQ